MVVAKTDAFLRTYLGARLWQAALLVAGLTVLGVLASIVFPKFEATALLQFPEVQWRPDVKGTELKPNEQRALQDPSKINVIELAAYKRVAASYDSVAPLRAYIEAVGSGTSPAAARLLQQAEGSDFWERVAVPILPFSRRDQREFGDIKDAPATALLGLELTADARTVTMAQEMIGIISGYYANAVMRERIRGWALTGKVEAQPQQKGLEADILRAELDIGLLARRAEDMKAVLARYPDAARMDARQLLSVNPAEGGERYLSPLAQLVGAESAISQRRESISRWQRELKQKRVLSDFFSAAEAEIEREIDVAKLLSSLRAISGKTFTHADAAMEWNREAALRIDAALDNFRAMRSQIGIRNNVRFTQVASRTPVRMGGLAAVLGLIVLGGLAFLRMSFAAARGERLADIPAVRN